jgi:hypothetical protein
VACIKFKRVYKEDTGIAADCTISAVSVFNRYLSAVTPEIQDSKFEIGFTSKHSVI